MARRVAGHLREAGDLLIQSVSVAVHSPPILIAGGAIGLFGCLILLRSRTDLDPPCVAPIRGLWLSAAILLTAACFGNALRGSLDPAVVYGPLNVLIITPFGLVWLGARRLLGHRSTVWWAALPPAIWMAATLLPGFVDSFTLRISIAIPLISALLVGSAVELYVLHRQKGLRSALDLGAMLAFVAAWLFSLYISAIMSPPVSPGNWGFLSPATALLFALVTGSLPLLMLAMARELSIVRDAAARLAATAAARAQVARLHEGLPAIIFLRAVAPDGDSRILYRGGDVASVTGLPVTDMRADGLPVSLPHSEVATFREHRRQVLRDGAASLVWHMPQPDGGNRVLRTMSRLLRWLPDGTAEVVGYTMDITAECEAEARVVAAARLAAVGEMGAGLAHEIKQPLQAISLASELMALALRHGRIEAIEERIGVIVDQAARAAEVVEHLRRFSQDVSGVAPTQSIDLGVTINAALRLTSHAVDQAGVAVELSLDGAAPCVRGHETSLCQVLVHLIFNACDAMRRLPPGAPRRLMIGAEAIGPARVTLTIADTGGGIEPEILPRLFVPFVTTKAPDGGKGIGLAASHALLRTMEGTITARNEGLRAVFAITLVAYAGTACNSTKDSAARRMP